MSGGTGYNTNNLLSDQRPDLADAISQEIQNSKNTFVVGIDISDIASIEEKLSGDGRNAAVLVKESISDLIDPEKARYNKTGTIIYTTLSGSEDEIRRRLWLIRKRINENYISITGIVAVEPSEEDKKLIMGNKKYHSLIFNKIDYMLEYVAKKNEIEVRSLKH